MKIPLVSLLSFIFCYLCWTHLGIAITVVHGQCLDNQQSLLLQLKSSLLFRNGVSKKLALWNESINCCKWNGVSCDDDGHVSGLDLSGESIHGGFDNSSSLFNLQNLKVLNLAVNNFNSGIPSGFNKLSNLTSLNLSYAGFVGQIPIEISQLTRLVTLDISSFSYLTGQQLELENPNLQKIVQNLTRIKQLYLDGVSIKAKGHEWTSALLRLPSLQEVSMSDCNLSGPLNSSLSTLTSLSVIRLNQNNLSFSVPESFANFRNLTELHLSSCRLGGEFPEKIFQVATLSVIDISFNKDLHGSLPEFRWNSPLHTLVVSKTNFLGTLPVSISNLSQLSILDLSNCQFNGTLPGSMSKLMELTYLDLSLNYFEGSTPSFNMSKNLNHLDLSHNDLTGSIPSAHFKGLKKLVLIDLQDNLINGNFPSSLFALPFLRSIRVSNNRFQGHLDEFSDIFSTMLNILDLSGNNLEGPIPPSIIRLKSLSVLLLSSNKFNGTIQMNMFQSLQNLTTLDLSYNQLSIDANVTDSGLNSLHKMSSVKLASCTLTEFPTFLRNQSRLTSLDLSSNHIRGSIPGWIWQVGFLTELNISHNFLTKLDGLKNISANLSVLDLHSNQLQGSLPIFPVSLTYLDYSANNFSSIIPSNIGTHLSFIIFLSLAKNNLSGSIPRSLCNNSNLLVLDLSHNEFNGAIPQCLTQSNSLVVLNLQNNKLDGNITDTFPESCALRSLHLNGNQLVGPIPRTLQNCTTLEVLNLGNNQIYDVFPCFLGKLSTLRVMVLWRNKFHGSIGCPMNTNTWQKLRIVDLAFNNFGDLLPGEDFRTWKAMMLDHDAAKFNPIQSAVLSFDHIYYQDSVTLTGKGLRMEFVRILTVLTFIDFSSNNFHGPIPEELMNFTALHVLNLSHNALTGQIPSSIGNLKQLESLDLSSNNFDGEIPAQLASLNFLSYLNLSFNNLEGKIPTGTQLQSFEETSFVGNTGLCGPPLTTSCRADKSNRTNGADTDSGENFADSGNKFDWTFILTGVGFGVGAGIVVAPCMFWERGRKWSNPKVDKILLSILPMFGLTYTPTEDDEAGEDAEQENSDMDEESDYNEDQDNLDHLRFQGKYCVLCSKFDIGEKKVIHNLRCTCYPSSSISISVYSESYS